MKVNGVEVTIGCDPEFFLNKDYTPTSAHFLIDEFGGKHNPLKLRSGMVQVDGTAVEFGIDPAQTADEFINRVDEVLLQIREKVPKMYDFKFFPVQQYSEEDFSVIPDSAKELGCEPDYDAYTLQANPKPNVQSTMRTGAGHIHVGWTSDLDTTTEVNKVQCAALVKQLDAVLFPVSLLWDWDIRRREMYGKPGAFRVKPYGVEYRVLSNAWLRSKSAQRWIFDATVHAFKLLMDGVVLPRNAWEHLNNPSDQNSLKLWEYANDYLVGKYGFPRYSTYIPAGAT